MLYRHTFIYFLSFGFPAFIAFISLAYFTRILTPDEFGYYSILLVIINFINSVLFQWIRLSLLRYRETYQSKDKDRELFSTLFFAFSLVMCVSVMLGLMANWILSDMRLTYSILFLVLVVSWLKAWHELNITLFRAEFSTVKYGIFSFVQALLAFLIGALFVVLFDSGGIGLIVGLGISLAITVIYPTYKKWIGTVKYSEVKLDSLKQFANFGIPLTFTFAMAFIINSSDKLFISWLLNHHSTGIYAAAYDFTDKSLLTIMSVVNLAAYPILIKVFERDGKHAAAVQMSNNATLILLVSFPAMIGLIALSDRIANVFFGEEFAVGIAAIIPLIALSAFLKGIKLYYVDLAFQLANQTKIQIAPVVVGALLNVVFNYILIPQYGLNGAAIATILSYLIALLIGVMIGRRFISYRFPWADSFKIMIAAAIMTVVLKMTAGEVDNALNLSFSIVIGMIAYAITIAFLFYKRTVSTYESVRKKFNI